MNFNFLTFRGQDFRSKQTFIVLNFVQLFNQFSSLSFQFVNFIIPNHSQFNFFKYIFLIQVIQFINELLSSKSPMSEPEPLSV